MLENISQRYRLNYTEGKHYVVTNANMQVQKNIWAAFCVAFF